MASGRRRPKLFGVAAAGAAALGAYALTIRPRILAWGATEYERQRSLPGDDIVPDPKMEATHAITIQASAAAVWPWLVQIGHKRGGWYSHDWIHRLMGIAGSAEDDRRSAEHIIPELQTLGVGDVVEIAPDLGYSVADIRPMQTLVLYVAMDASTGRPFDPAEETPASHLTSSWTWFLDEIDQVNTRLIVRIRMDYNPTLRNVLMIRGLIEPGSFVMERKTLLGIKQRAESLVR